MSWLATDEKQFFINLHCPYDIKCIRHHKGEYNFDNAARILWILDKDKKIERSLNNRFVEKWDMGDDGIFKNARVFGEEEVETLYQRMIKDLSEILGVLRSNPKGFDLYSVTQNAKEVFAFIEKAISYDYQKAIKDKKRFEAIYGKIEIFPNDLQMPLIIQLTNGCAYNKCTFCGFYKHTPFRIKNLSQIKQHIQAIKSFMGESLLNRQTIFLGDANALMLEQDLLLQILDSINEEFNIAPSLDSRQIQENIQFNRNTDSYHYFEGIFSFIDAFYGVQKAVKDFRELKRRNIKRIYIGMESGANKILSFVKKCNKAEQIVTLTNMIKEAGIPVGIMLIAGLGGKRLYCEHVKESIRILNNLNLDSNDTIYFSHLFFHDMATYWDEMQMEGITALGYEEENRQIQEIVSGLNFAHSDSPDIKGYEIKYVRF